MLDFVCSQGEVLPSDSNRSGSSSGHSSCVGEVVGGLSEEDTPTQTNSDQGRVSVDHDQTRLSAAAVSGAGEPARPVSSVSNHQ